MKPSLVVKVARQSDWLGRDLLVFFNFHPDNGRMGAGSCAVTSRAGDRGRHYICGFLQYDLF